MGQTFVSINGPKTVAWRISQATTLRKNSSPALRSWAMLTLNILMEFALWSPHWLKLYKL